MKISLYLLRSSQVKIYNMEIVSSTFTESWIPHRHKHDHIIGDAIDFGHYSAKYGQQLPLVLDDIDCGILAGERIGVVGRTGAGKSSLTMAMFRLLETAAGKIRFNGEDIAGLPLKDLRRRITIIPQEPFLFSGTIRQNLDPLGKHGDAEILRALELTHLKTSINGLEAGLCHEIDQNCSFLSVGQRQLFCLARALLRNTKLLILDEATASIDLHTESLIQRTIREQFTQCTTIIIAHRIRTILDCDRVMVMDHGRIKEFDTPSALLANHNSGFSQIAREANVMPKGDT